MSKLRLDKSRYSMNLSTSTQDTSRKAAFLAQMGIQSWRANGAVLPATMHSLRYETWSVRSLDQQQVGVVWLEQIDSPHTSSAIYSLLDAMLKALKLTRHAVDRHTLWMSGGVHLIFGERLAQQLLDQDVCLPELRKGNLYAGSRHSRILVTYHPADLLSHPENKALAWQDLRPLKLFLYT